MQGSQWTVNLPNVLQTSCGVAPNSAKRKRANINAGFGVLDPGDPLLSGSWVRVTGWGSGTQVIVLFAYERREGERDWGFGKKFCCFLLPQG